MKGSYGQDSVTLMVSSAVPEGKGVSSSASVEVATMSAIAAAHGQLYLPAIENEKSSSEAFKALLTAATTDEQLSALGELMYQCHYSYSECGLGSNGTDRLVKLVQEVQHLIHEFGYLNLGFVVIFQIQQKYKGATGYLPIIFDGSSPGAGKFGYLKIRRLT
ncbi:hypothetical protein B296_00034164 [Ensete ventricosum]|uniref:GHMP kinase N-terminal domain-containing protein n=1 Tax=Ensete ventricosum TaxID=4639 RepID=A0A427A0N0_ENSVE|nr:hypothetical protein B296_00034164 [Ensete ventricosum]